MESILIPEFLLFSFSFFPWLLHSHGVCRWLLVSKAEIMAWSPREGREEERSGREIQIYWGRRTAFLKSASGNYHHKNLWGKKVSFPRSKFHECNSSLESLEPAGVSNVTCVLGQPTDSWQIFSSTKMTYSYAKATVGSSSLLRHRTAALPYS